MLIHKPATKITESLCEGTFMTIPYSNMKGRVREENMGGESNYNELHTFVYENSKTQD